MAERNKQKLLPAYLAVGEDALKRKAAAKRIKKIIKPDFKAFNVSEFDSQALSDVSSLCDALEQIPFSDNYRIVIIYAADKLSKDASVVVLNYLAHPNPTTVLLLEAEKLAKNARIRKAVEQFGKSSVIDCGIPKGYALHNYVQEIAQSKHGLVLDREAISALIDAYGGEDTALLDNALQTLSRSGKQRIGAVEVKELLPRLESPKPWLFADALANRSYKEAILLFSNRKQGEESLLFWYATNRLRELICARTLIDEGNPGKLSEVLGGPAWKYKKHISQAKLFTSRELSSALQKAVRVERALKGSLDAELAFTFWIDTICNGNK